MAIVTFIIQGEGKGHFSQAEAMFENLSQKGHQVDQIFVSKNFSRKMPGYFKTALDAKVSCFYSPNFLLNGNKKGIRVRLSIMLNVLLAPLYIFEALRLGVKIRINKADEVYNFYDVVGGLACRWLVPKKKVTVLAHHFYLSHPGFEAPHGFGRQQAALWRMSRFLMNSAAKVNALSFRKDTNIGKLTVVPPLLSEKVLSMEHVPGKRDLGYFLNPGFVREMLAYYHAHPELEADIFTDHNNEDDVPGNVQLYPTSRDGFLEKMTQCRRIISTAGFETVAEAFYLGIPIFLIPSENHYEQYCNALDAARTGMAYQLDSIAEMEEAEFELAGNKGFRKWVRG